MDPITLLVILLVLIVIFGGGGWNYYSRRDGYAGPAFNYSPLGLILGLIILFLILRYVLHVV